MKIFKTNSYDEMSSKAAELISQQIINKPESVLGLATGSTPIGMYELLVNKHREKGLDFSKIKTVNLDEYVKISPNHESSYTYFMKHHLFDHININKSNYYLPNSNASDYEDECKRYDDVLDDLDGIDLQILGIGHNGHIGFNEPMDHYTKGTHVIELTTSTINANSRLFEDPSEIPTKAITMGIQSIMKAKKIILLANGINKAEIINKSLFGAITPQVPASVLQLHPNLVVIGDEEALSRLDNY